MAQKFAAPLLDQYLARTGFDSQQTGERAEPRTPRTTSGSRSTSRRAATRARTAVFDDRSQPRSAQLTVTERVEEAGATVRRAFGSLLGAARARAPQHPWSAATSQQTDSDALPASEQADPAAGPRR